jgi:cysteine desulfurase/selenocysteine lyase
MDLVAHFGPLDFPIFSNKTLDGTRFVYLDSAATTQKPLHVVARMQEFYLHQNATVHRAIYEIGAEATDRYNYVRVKLQQFLHAASEDEIVFTSGTTDSLNLLAYSYGEAFLQEGDEILVSQAEHHANIVPWFRLCERKKTKLRIIPLLDDGAFDLKSFISLLSPKVKIVSIAHTTNTTGALYPIKQITKLAHQVGSIVIVDGAQAVAHQTIDVQELDCDFFVFSGHKMYGPTGVGVLYGKYELLEKMPPFKSGGDMIERVSFEQITYQKPPLRFEAGTPMIAEVIGLGAAVDYLNALGIKNIQVHEKNLTEYALTQLKIIPHLHILGTSKERGSLITFYIQGVHSLDLGTILNVKGVCVRTGLMCAEPYFRSQKVASGVRISFGVYSTFEDVDYFIKVLKESLYLIKPEMSY